MTAIAREISGYLLKQTTETKQSHLVVSLRVASFSSLTTQILRHYGEIIFFNVVTIALVNTLKGDTGDNLLVSHPSLEDKNHE